MAFVGPVHGLQLGLADHKYAQQLRLSKYLSAPAAWRAGARQGEGDADGAAEAAARGADQRRFRQGVADHCAEAAGTEREHAARLQMQRSLERRSPSPR